MEGATRFAYVCVPAECERCDVDRNCADVLRRCARSIFRRWPDQRHQVVRIGITERFLQNLHNFTSLRLTDGRRDISSPFANTLDASSGVPPELQTMLFYVLGSMSLRAHGRERRSMRAFGTAMRSTQFLREGNAAPGPGAPAGMARLKVVWDRINLHGHGGMQAYLSGPRDVLNEVAPNRPPDETAESSRVMQQAEPMPDARPAPGVIAGFLPSPSVTVSGPVMEIATVHDPRGVSHSTESRVKPTLGPNGEPRKFLENSDSGKRLKSWFGALSDAVTVDVIREAHFELFGEKQLGEVAAGAFSAEMMRELVSRVQMAKTNSDLPTRKASGKREVIPKDGKDVRSVVDNTGEVFTAAFCAGKTLEHICFGKDKGLFRHVCIKHRTRNKVAQEMQRDLSQRNCLAWEIDQTRMEAHIRVPGSLRLVMGLLERVMGHVMSTYSGQLTHAYKARLQFDQQHGMRIRMSVSGVCVPGGKKTVTLQFSDFYLDSGWLLTSLANFLLETGATAACCVANPGHMFARDRDGSLRIVNNTFNHLYRGIAVDGVKPEKPVYYRSKHEGDDGAGQIGKNAGDPTALARTVVANMADLGFDAKFKIIENGRLEFVGLHAAVMNGAIQKDVPIIPAVMRSLGKLGVNAQTPGRTPQQMAAMDAFRFYSIGEMFAGKIPAIADIFKSCGDRMLERAGEEANVEHTFDEYSGPGRAWGAGKYRLSTVGHSFDVRHSDAPPMSEQLRALCVSLERTEMDPCTLAKLEILASDCRKDVHDHLACYMQLPPEMRADNGAN